MWRGTTTPGKRTRLGRGKRAISIKSYEEFFVLPCVIDSAAGFSEKEGSKTAAEPLRDCSNLARRAHHRILDNFGCLVDSLDDVLADAVETRQLHVQCFTSAGDHSFDPPELIARGQ